MTKLNRAPLIRSNKISAKTCVEATGCNKTTKTLLLNGIKWKMRGLFNITHVEIIYLMTHMQNSPGFNQENLKK
jgi:hypothetical protein